MDRVRPTAKKGQAVVPWSPLASRDEARESLQERLALFSKVWFWCFVILLAFAMGLFEIYPSTRPPRVGIVHTASFIGLSILGGVWYFILHKGKPSLEQLYLIDGFYAGGVGVILAMSAYYQSELLPAGYYALIWHTFWVFSRVFIVPSDATRTLIVTGISFVPFIVCGFAMAINVPERLGVPGPAFVGGDFLFVSIATGLSTLGSSVMYGLRREAREARQLGAYTTGEIIGRGGMGVVYKARHAMLRRATAIKVLPREKYGVEGLRRFDREVQNMSRLTHPNTVAIFDYGHSAAGDYYYAMEYLDGVDLDKLVRRDGPQPAPRVIHILRQICGALDEAHSIGLTHRDIKPANVILCQRGRAPDVAKVVDFGLVKELARDTHDSQSAFIAGTPAYLAPEGVTDPDKVGPHSDLYSLGCVGYYLLTGKPVFEAKTEIDVLIQHRTAQPVPPSQRTTQPIPEELETLILCCLAKEPAHRPVSAQAMRLALGKIPAYADYDENTWLAWWREFDERRASLAGQLEADVPLTITVDLADRTQSDQLSSTVQVM
jgi:serine/threonine protein kinase